MKDGYWIVVDEKVAERCSGVKMMEVMDCLKYLVWRIDTQQNQNRMRIARCAPNV